MVFSKTKPFLAPTRPAARKLNYCHRGISRQRNIRDLRRTAALNGPACAGGRGYFFATTSSCQKNSAMTIDFFQKNGDIIARPAQSLNFFPRRRRGVGAETNHCHRGISRQRNIRDLRRTAALNGPACAGGRGYFFAADFVAAKKFRDDSNFFSIDFFQNGFFPKPNHSSRRRGRRRGN